MKKRLILGVVIAGILTACGGGGGGSTPATTPPTTTPPTTTPPTTTPKESVFGDGQTTTINRTGNYTVDITGGTNTVTISAGNTVGELSITGNSNTVTMQPTAAIVKIAVTGDNNTIFVPVGYTVATDFTGTGNAVIQR